MHNAKDERKKNFLVIFMIKNQDTLYLFRDKLIIYFKKNKTMKSKATVENYCF